MIQVIAKWLKWKWASRDHTSIYQDINGTFNTLHGQRVIFYLLDTTYCTVYEGKDPLELAFHNGRRSVVQELLELIDQAEHPQKYEIKTYSEGQGVTDGLGR